MDSWYIKERHSPQLGKYYIPLGQLDRETALALKRTDNGVNFMLEYPTEAEYKAAAKRLIIDKLPISETTFKLP